MILIPLLLIYASAKIALSHHLEEDELTGIVLHLVGGAISTVGLVWLVFEIMLLAR